MRKSIVLAGSMVIFVLCFFYVFSWAETPKPDVVLSGTGLENGGKLETRVVIEGLTKDAIEIGLSEDIIRSSVELQLRKNGIKPTQTQTVSFLYVRVSIIGNSFGIDCWYNRSIFYYVGNQCYYKCAPVWETGSHGTHTGRLEYILEWIRQGVDEFSNEFLKANGK